MGSWILARNDVVFRAKEAKLRGGDANAITRRGTIDTLAQRGDVHRVADIPGGNDGRSDIYYLLVGIGGPYHALEG